MGKGKIHSGLASIDVRFRQDATAKIAQLERGYMQHVRTAMPQMPRQSFHDTLGTMGQPTRLNSPMDSSPPEKRRSARSSSPAAPVMIASSQAVREQPLSFTQDLAVKDDNTLSLAKRRVWRG